MQQLRTVAARVQLNAELLLPVRKLRIAVRSIAVAEFVVQQPTSALAWSKDLDIGETASTPDLNDVERLLRAPAESSDQSDAYRQCAEDLLKQLPGEERRELLIRGGDLAILSAFDCKLEQKTSVSAKRIRDSFSHATLFRTGQGTTDGDRAGLRGLFQLVLPVDPVFVVNNQLAELILGGPTPELLLACDSCGVLHCLAHEPRRLGEPRARQEPLGRVRLPDSNRIAVRGMRFLLHGGPTHHNGTETLWVAQGERSSGWRKVWEAVTSPSERWTMVDGALAAQLPTADWGAVDLRAIITEEVVRLVAQTGCERLNSLRLDSVEYDAILAHEKWDERTWRSLPFHSTTTGQRDAIGAETVYLEQPGLASPQHLLGRIHVIVLSPDQQLAALQEQRIPKLDQKAEILVAVEDDAPDLWCDCILDWLANITLSGRVLPVCW
jgi:hypothetical protein